jgi:hypothetical protein
MIGSKSIMMESTMMNPRRMLDKILWAVDRREIPQ